MQTNLKKWRWGAIFLMIALLSLGLATLAAPQTFGKAVGQVPPETAQHKALMDQVRHPVKNTTGLPQELKDLRQEMQDAHLKVRDFVGLGHPTLQQPAYKQYFKAIQSLVKQGKIKQVTYDRAEKLCDADQGWWNGTSLTANTNGTSTVWGGGLNLYFAATSDPTHPVLLPLGDIPMRVFYQGNIVVVLNMFTTYWFDVTDPTNPGFLNGIYGGYFDFFTAAIPTADGNFLALTVGPDEFAVIESATFNIPFDDYIENMPNSPYNGGPAWMPLWNQEPWLSDMVIPATPGNVAIITDADTNSMCWGGFGVGNAFVHFVDLSDPMCKGVTYLGDINDSFVFDPINPGGDGDNNCGQLVYQAPYLYMSYYPWDTWNPEADCGYSCPFNIWWVDLYSIPDITNPFHHAYIKEVSKTADDIVAMRETGHNNIALGTLQGKVMIWDAQMNNLVDFNIFGTYSGNGACAADLWDFETNDMGYAPGGGVTADGAGGAHFFVAPSLTETGSYMTGDWSTTPAFSGSEMFVPNYWDGLAVVDNTDPANPATLGWLGLAGMPYLNAVAAMGNTVFVTSTFSSNTKVFAADVTNPAAPAYISTSGTAYDVTSVAGGGTVVLSLAVDGGLVYIGTETGIHVVDFSVPSAPMTVAFMSDPFGVYAMTFFTHPAYPLSRFVVVSEGILGWDIYDVTPPGPACVLSYFWVATGIPNGGGSTDGIIANGSYLYYVDATLDLVQPILLTPGPACGAGELAPTYAGMTAFFTGGLGPAIWVPNSPYLIANAGTAGGVTFAVVSSPYLAIQLDISTDPTSPAYVPFSTLYPSSGLNTGFYMYEMWITGLVANNNTMYNSEGFAGVSNWGALQPGIVPPTVGVPTVTPLDHGSLIKDTVTITVHIVAGDTAVKSVDLYYDYSGAQYHIATLTHTTAAGAFYDYTYNWDSTAYWPQAAFYTCDGPITAIAHDAGCFSIGNSTGNIPIEIGADVELSDFSPAPPGGVCAPASTWVVCGLLSFDIWATDGGCNGAFTGITQVALYVDGQLYDYYNNPPNPWAYVLNTATLPDGLHTLKATATDALGITTASTVVSFVSHNLGPVTTITAPTSGDVVAGTAIRVAATAVSQGSNDPIVKVDFYLDWPGSGFVKLGTSTALDTQGEYSIVWDATATGTNTAFGNHTLMAFGFDGSGACIAEYTSAIVSFRLIPYVPMTLTANAAPTSGTVPLPVSFNATVAGGVGPFVYSWDFGDGTTFNGTSSASHTYTAGGTFTWKVTVTDAGYPAGTPQTAGGTITATYVPLSVSAVVTPGQAVIPAAATFLASVSGGLAPYSYAWDFGDGSTGTGSLTSHTYTTAGTFNWALTVTDSASATASANGTFTAIAPLTVTATGTPASGIIPLSVSFSATAAGGIAPYTYTWAYGDGGTGTGATSSHSYAAIGTYTWNLVVHDSLGLSATASGTVTAMPVPPMITGVTKMTDPLRLKVLGSNFHANCTIYINGTAVTTSFKDSSKIIAKGSNLSTLLPKGVAVAITVKNNDDGGVSAAFSYTR